MRTLLAVCGGAAAAASVAFAVTGTAGAETIDVTGKPFVQAVALLKAQGIKAYFGGAVGSDLPQSQCPVVSMTGPSSASSPFVARYVRLRLDCTLPADTPPGVVPGANGVTTITATPVPYAPVAGAAAPAAPGPVAPPA